MKNSRAKNERDGENQTKISAFFQKNKCTGIKPKEFSDKSDNTTRFTKIVEKTATKIHPTTKDDTNSKIRVNIDDGFSPDVINPTPEVENQRRKICGKSADQIRCKLFSVTSNDGRKELNSTSQLNVKSRTISVKRQTTCDQSPNIKQPSKLIKSDMEFIKENRKIWQNNEISIIKETQVISVDISENIDVLNNNFEGLDAGKGIKDGGIYEMDDEFLECFDKMSPFKSQESERTTKTSPFLSGLGRHVVKNVERSDFEITLNLFSEEDGVERKCILRDFWIQTHVKIDDVVNILSEFDENRLTVIDNESGLIVVNPDKLISGTSVVSSLFCMRKSVLMEKYRLVGPASFAMICGNFVHQIFQQVLDYKIYDISAIRRLIDDILSQTSNLHAMFGAGVTEKEVLEEIDKFIPQIKTWIEKYVFNPDLPNHVHKEDNNNVQIVKIHDIEENIWSPRFGIKGKVDLTVEVQIHKTRKIVPLELKTGKSSFSAEHEGQVILYSLMTSDRREDPKGGLLLYLRDGQTKEILAEHNQKRGLIQLRNELVHYLTQKTNYEALNLNDKIPTNILTDLPKPLNNRRFCSGCPYLTVCCLHSSMDLNCSNLSAGHEMTSLVPEATKHLTSDHKNYFHKWQLLLELESSTNHKNFITDIYKNSSEQREEKGFALSQMKFSHPGESTSTCGGYFLEKFEKTTYKQSLLSNNGLSIGDLVVVSCEATKQFAIATGTVVDIQDTFIQIEVDKNLRIGRDVNSTDFRLDRYSYGNVIAISAGNLASLMEPTEKSDNLRRLVIDKQIPRFQAGLNKTVMKGKPILKGLNKPQLRAIFRSMMADDYLLIKGMPGTGKTSTIVALVRLLNLLDYSVLLTSYTHSAVDTILLKLKKYGVDFLRLGKSYKIHPEIIEKSSEKLVARFKSVKELKDFYNSQKIIATTCLGSNHPCLQGRHFDICVIDEASQIMQISGLGPLFLAERFVLIGDPKQLPPLVQNKTSRKLGMDESLFSRLDSPSSTVELNLQYRMNKEIMRLCNDLVYDNALKCGSDEVASSTIRLPNSSSLQIPSTKAYLNLIISSELKDSVLFLNTDQIPASESSDNGGFKNEIEAKLILQFILTFQKGGVELTDIGVMSFYNSQVSLLREELRHHNLQSVEVNTVDQYQGRDKQIILVSFVRTTNQLFSNILHDIRRLNVAITRAKHKLILIGSVPTLSTYPPINKLISNLRSDQIIKLTNSAIL